GHHLTSPEIATPATAYRIRLLDAGQAAAGFPYLIGTTNPPTLQSFLFRNTDLPNGTTDITNFTFGMQTNDYCIDFKVTPSTPGGPLVGTYHVSERNGSSCGDPVQEDRSAVLIPSGGAGAAGTFC